MRAETIHGRCIFFLKYSIFIPVYQQPLKFRITKYFKPFCYVYLSLRSKRFRWRYYSKVGSILPLSLSFELSWRTHVACSAGVSFGRANVFARESAMLKLPEERRKWGESQSNSPQLMKLESANKFKKLTSWAQRDTTLQESITFSD